VGIIKAINLLIRAFLVPQFSLVAENLALRQQVAVYQHTVKRPKLRPHNRIFWVWLSRLWSNWRSALAIVQPETVIKWHRQGFKLYWRWKSRSRKAGRPPIQRELRDLIRRMSRENPLRGAPLRCGRGDGPAGGTRWQGLRDDRRPHLRQPAAGGAPGGGEGRSLPRVRWGQVFSVHVTNKHDGCRLVNNIFYYPTSVPNAAVAIAWPTKDLRLVSDHNLFGPMVERTQVAYVYRSSILDLAAGGPTRKQWQQESGQDAHSLQTDPLFVAPQAGDFRLRPGSPAIGAGEGGTHIGACGVADVPKSERAAGPQPSP